MNRISLQTKLDDINYLKKSLGQFKKQANIFINNVKRIFDENDISTTEIKNNSLEFSLWGLDFIVKAEISYDAPSLNFIKGELNTYFKNEEQLEIVLTYNFDKHGNIGRNNIASDFGQYYYIDFIDKIISLSGEGKFKFLLS